MQRGEKRKEVKGRRRKRMWKGGKEMEGRKGAPTIGKKGWDSTMCHKKKRDNFKTISVRLGKYWAFIFLEVW